ncbi:MAG: hypothetical protein ABI411_11360 [Tahibacter sp.]
MLSLLPFRQFFVALALVFLSASVALSAEPIGLDGFIRDAEFIAGDGAANSQFGVAVDIEGDTAVVGAVGTLAGTPAGSAYVYFRVNGSWNLQTVLTPDTTPPKSFGNSVSISGNTLVIGAGGSTTEIGAAYVFLRTGTTWAQQAKLTASDGAINDLFGAVVAVDGNTAVIGARLDDVGANADQGSAYVFVRSGTAWTQQQKLTASDGAATDNFGIAVDVIGNTVIVGSNQDDNSALTDNGAAYVYTRSGTVWTQQPKLIANDTLSNDKFGRSVDFNSATEVVIGATGADAGYVFKFDLGAWVPEAKLKPAVGFVQAGISVALQGDIALVGDNFNTVNGNANGGAIFVFSRTGATWTEVDRLTVNDSALQDQMSFGLALNGNTAIAGAPFKDLGLNTNQGVAYTFDFDDVIFRNGFQLP